MPVIFLEVARIIPEAAYRLICTELKQYRSTDPHIRTGILGYVEKGRKRISLRYEPVSDIPWVAVIAVLGDDFKNYVTRS